MTVGRAAVDGVRCERTGRSVAQRWDAEPPDHFSPAGELIAASTCPKSWTVYAQDTWNCDPQVVHFLGRRGVRATTARPPAQAPTVSPGSLGWTVKKPPHRRGESFSGSVGLFADKLVPGSPRLPIVPAARRPGTFDGADAMLGLADCARMPSPVPCGPTRASRWDVQFDRQFADGWPARASLPELARTRRAGYRFRPSLPGRARRASWALGNSGRSDARSGGRHGRLQDCMPGASFTCRMIRSSARGDLNSFDALQGPFKEAFISRTGRVPCR